MGIFGVGGAGNFPFVLLTLKTWFIVNPMSGCAPMAMPRVFAFAAYNNARLELTRGPGHAAKLAQKALEYDAELIVAVGGDGTMNEVASVLVGSPAVLGLIPCGSGDGLGRHLCLHGNTELSLQVLRRGEPRWIDTGLADGHMFFACAGIGFEAEMARRFNAIIRRGFRRYVKTCLGAFREWQPETYTIRSSEGSETVRAFTLAVCNANQYGNDARIAPDAQLDDGQFDVCTLPPVNWWNALPLARHLFRGNITRVKGVRIRRSGHFTVERANPGLLHTDGEPHQAGRSIEFTIRPASLQIMLPHPNLSPDKYPACTISG